jgi:Tfp pilus assembly protein PilN
MQQSLEAMTTALRVLTALTSKRHPDSADIETLREYVPLLRDEPADKLACEVIEQALRHRAIARSAQTGAE